MARRWPRALLALAVVAAFAVMPVAPSSSATLTWTATCGNNEVTQSPIPRSDGVEFVGGSGCSSSSVTVDGMQNFQLTGQVYKLASGASWGWIQVSTGAGYTKFVVGASGEAPGSPQTPTVSLSGTTASISVTGATATGGLPDSFLVTASPGGATCSVGSPTGTPRQGSCSISGLTVGTTYTFTATATNTYGTSSASSASSSVTPQPAAPSSPQQPTGVSQNAAVEVTVVDSATGGTPTSFQVTSSPGNFTCTAGSLTGTPRSGTCTVTGLTNGTSYTFTATATNGGGTSTSSAASAPVTPTNSGPAPQSAPDPPPAPSATAGDGEASVTVTGAGTGATPTSFTVTASPGGGTCSIGSPTGTPPAGSCTVSSLTNGTSYTFTATASNSGGTSSASGASSAVIPRGPQTITYSQPANQELATSSLTVAPTTNATGNSVTLASNTTSVCTVSGFTIIFVAAGTCTTTASAGAYGAYAAATNVTRSFTITSAGGGGGVTPATASPSAAVERKVTLCHRTASFSNPYVEITVDQNSVLSQGHGSHTGGVYPAAGWGDIIPPFDGYAGLNWTPEGQTILASGCDAAKARGKVTLCHATSSKTNPYVLITVDRNAVLKKGHGSHTGGLYPTKGWGDIIPPFDDYAGLNWPGGQAILDSGCSPNGPIDPNALVPEQPRCLADNSAKGEPLTRDQIVLKPGKSPNQVDIESKDGEPLTLLSMEVNDPNNSATLEVESAGADPKQASTWQSPSTQDVCWTVGAFNGTDYSYTLPAVSPPSSAGSGPWEYTKAVVSAAGVSATSSRGQAETVFSSPKAGDVVWADVNGNGIFDPSGLMGGRTNTSPVRDGKVTLCHRTRSKTNPYVEITVDKSAVLNQKLGKEEGHGTHTGPIFPAAGWGDIIPAFDNYPGMNWPAGRDILESGCNVDDDRDKAVQQVILCAKRVPVPEPTDPSPICEAPISRPSPSSSPSSSGTSTPAPSSSIPETLSSPTPSPGTSVTPSASGSPSPSTVASVSPSASSSPGSSGSPSPSSSASPTTSSPSSPRPSVASTSSSPSASGSPSPSTSAPRPPTSASPTPSPTPTDSTPPPIIIRVLPSPSPTPTPPSSSSTPTPATGSPTPSTSTSSPRPSSASASPSPSPTPTNSSPTSPATPTTGGSPSPSSSQGSGSPTPGGSATPTPGATGSMSSPSPSPSDTGLDPGASATPSSTPPGGTPDSGPSSPPGSTGALEPGQDPEREDPSTPETRGGFVKFKVAQGDSTLTFVVPMTRMKALAAQAGEPTLADTGSSRTLTVTAAVVLLAAGLMLLPAVRRGRG